MSPFDTQVCHERQICLRFHRILKVILEMTFSAHCTLIWKLNRLSTTIISKVAWKSSWCCDQVQQCVTAGGNYAAELESMVKRATSACSPHGYLLWCLCCFNVNCLLVFPCYLFLWLCRSPQYFSMNKLPSKHHVNGLFMVLVMATNGRNGIWLAISYLKWHTEGRPLLCHLWLAMSEPWMALFSAAM